MLKSTFNNNDKMVKRKSLHHEHSNKKQSHYSRNSIIKTKTERYIVLENVFKIVLGYYTITNDKTCKKKI